MSERFIEMLKYVFFGVLAALINTLLYAFFTRIFSLSTLVSTAIAWLLANIFAYFANKIFVFNDGKKQIGKILIALGIFLFSRLISGLGDMLTMSVFVDKLRWPDIPVKITSSFLFGVINYLLGKFIIFKKKDIKNKD